MSEPRTRYHSKSRESTIVEMAGHRMNEMLAHFAQEHPIPPGEKRIDQRTANKRLQQIPTSELYDHYAGQG